MTTNTIKATASKNETTPIMVGKVHISSSCLSVGTVVDGRLEVVLFTLKTSVELTKRVYVSVVDESVLDVSVVDQFVVIFSISEFTAYSKK